MLAPHLLRSSHLHHMDSCLITRTSPLEHIVVLVQPFRLMSYYTSDLSKEHSVHMKLKRHRFHFEEKVGRGAHQLAAWMITASVFPAEVYARRPLLIETSYFLTLPWPRALARNSWPSTPIASNDCMPRLPIAAFATVPRASSSTNSS